MKKTPDTDYSLTHMCVCVRVCVCVCVYPHIQTYTYTVRIRDVDQRLSFKRPWTLCLVPHIFRNVCNKVLFIIDTHVYMYICAGNNSENGGHEFERSKGV